MTPTNLIFWENGQGAIANQLRSAGAQCAAKFKLPPNLIVVVLPEGGNDIYTAVKQYVLSLISKICKLIDISASATSRCALLAILMIGSQLA
jgi:hypothetical protein